MEATNEGEGGEEEETNKVEKKGGFAGCPLRRGAGMFAGRANPWNGGYPNYNYQQQLEEVSSLGRRSPGGEGGEMATD